MPSPHPRERGRSDVGADFPVCRVIVQYGTARHNTAQHGTARHSTVQYSTDSTIQFQLQTAGRPVIHKDRITRTVSWPRVRVRRQGQAGAGTASTQCETKCLAGILMLRSATSNYSTQLPATLNIPYRQPFSPPTLHTTNLPLTFQPSHNLPRYSNRRNGNVSSCFPHSSAPSQEMSLD